MASANLSVVPKTNVIPPNRVDGVMKSTTGNYSLYTKYWKPQTTLRGVVFIAHGYGEYTEYYEDIAQALFNERFFVFSHDHLGYGRSDGPRGYINNVDDYVNDGFAHFKKIEEENNTLPRLPYFIIGLSMGGTIAIKMGIKKPDMFRGICLLVPAITVNPEMAGRCLTTMARVVSKLFPNFPVAPIEYDMMSRHKEKVEIMAGDPLCLHGFVKARWTVAMMNAFDEIQYSLTKVQWPYLLQQGKGDVVVGTEGAQMFHDKTSSKDKTLVYYNGAYHHLLQELDYCTDLVTQRVIEWISKRADSDVDFEISVTETVPVPKVDLTKEMELLKVSDQAEESSDHEVYRESDQRDHHDYGY